MSSGRGYQEEESLVANVHPAKRVYEYKVQLDAIVNQGPVSPVVVGVDPKAAFGATKPSLALVPAVGVAAAALAQEDGAKKYGGYNFRKGHPVEIMTYLHAAKRHLDAFIDGEDFTSDTGVPNLGAVSACVTIVMDVMANGVGVDNRPPPGKASAFHDAAKLWKKAISEGMLPSEASRKFLAPVMGYKS